jgi:methionyl-tRNA formyltransferase
MPRSGLTPMARARVVLFADGDIGLQIVRIALDHEPSLVGGLVTAADKTRLGQLATDFSIPHVAYDIARLDETADKIHALNGNVFILAWWPHVLARKFLQLGQDVTLNLHPSLLPHGRGKDPNFWAIVEGSPFGVTIHHVVPDVDAGDIAFAREIAYGWEDTGESLYRRAAAAIVELFREAYPRIVNFDIPRHPQSRKGGSSHRRRELDERSLIDLDQHYTARELLNLLRARTFEPHPACRFVEGGKTYEVRVSIRRKT